MVSVPPPPSKAPRIVICDDSETVRALIPTILGDGYEFLVAESAEELLARAPDFGPDLVISDILMEGMDGVELCQRIKRNPSYADVPVILLTSMTEEDARATGLEAGADEYLFKPIRARELCARVSSLLRLREMTVELRNSRRALREILDNIHQAVLTVGPDLMVGPEHSRYVAQVLGDVPIGARPLADVLAPGPGGEGTRAGLEAWLRLAFTRTDVSWDVLSQLVQSDFKYTRPDGSVRELTLEFQPIAEGRLVKSVMVVVEDQTEKRALERDLAMRTRENEENLAHLAELIQIDERVFEQFLGEARHAVESSRQALQALARAARPKEVVGGLFREMHTLKGNARSFRLNRIAQKAHEVEDTFAQLRDASAVDPSIVSETQRRLLELEELLGRVSQLAIKVLKRQPDLGNVRGSDRPMSVGVTRVQLDELASLVQKLKARPGEPSLLARLEGVVRSLGVVPLARLFQRFSRMVHDLAEEEGKSLAAVDVVSNGVLVHGDVLHSLAPALVHVLRNAVHHGLEPPDQRVARGKPAGCSVRVVARMTPDWLEVSVSDDGRGIDAAALGARAVKMGLVSRERLAQLSEAQVQALVFEQGLSTAEAVTELAGRGVGMAVVRESLERLGGAVELSSERGAGTVVRLSVPRRIAERGFEPQRAH